MLFPTTIAGSLPKPEWLAEPNTLWAPWKSKGDELARAKRDATILAVKLQEDAGIDIVTDGEQARQHFVHGFLEKIEGIDFAHKVEMGIRKDRYKAMVPQVVAPLMLKGRVHADEARVARTHTTRKLKFTLPGPMTIADTVADKYYGDKVKMAFAFAELLNNEARALQADGVDVIQFDEPAFNVFMDEVSDWGIKALERAAEGLTCTTAVHICYGYGIKANTDWKRDRWELSGGNTRIFSRRSRKARSSRLRSSAAIRRCRWICWRLSRQGHPGRRHRRRQRHGGDRRRCRQGDRGGVEIRAAWQHRRDHELRHGADAPRYRGSQACGARRGREAGQAEVGLMFPFPLPLAGEG